MVGLAFLQALRIFPGDAVQGNQSVPDAIQVCGHILRGEVPIVGKIIGKIRVGIIAHISGHPIPDIDQIRQCLGNLLGTEEQPAQGRGGLAVLGIILVDEPVFLIHQRHQVIIPENLLAVSFKEALTEELLLQFVPAGGLGQSVVQILQHLLYGGNSAGAEAVLLFPVAVGEVDAVVNIRQIAGSEEPVIGIVEFKHPIQNGGGIVPL